MSRAQTLTTTVLTFAALLTLVAATGCSTAPEYIEDPASSLTYLGFLSALNAAGQSVDDYGETDAPNLDAPHERQIAVRGEEMYVYEYDSDEDAEAAAATVSADASTVDGQAAEWPGESPRLYGEGSVIVAYGGSDDAIAELLATTLGDPFAAAE